jgi:hypothetical protein
VGAGGGAQKVVFGDGLNFELDPAFRQGYGCAEWPTSEPDTWVKQVLAVKPILPALIVPLSYLYPASILTCSLNKLYVSRLRYYHRRNISDMADAVCHIDFNNLIVAIS